VKEMDKSTEREEQDAIRQAVLDYAEGIYNADPARIERSVHPSLHKGGFFEEREGGPYSFTTMTFAEMVDLSKRYNADGQMPKAAPKEITIFDVQEQIASAKLIAWWGTDYMHLAKYGGKWMIVNVFWQTHPAQSDRLADMSKLASH
jgi:hypothetical protein